MSATVGRWTVGGWAGGRGCRTADRRMSKGDILSAHGDDAYIERATVVGAAGFLVKHTSVHLLAEVIREVHKGNRHLIPVSEETTGPRGQKSRGGNRLATAK
jgi:DNA-binding NarL/FixJ family response regulator